MKKFNLGTGISFSLLLSLIAVLLRLIRIESADLVMYIILIGYYFFFSLSCWIANILLINSKLIGRHTYNKHRFYFISIFIGGLLSLLFVYLNIQYSEKELLINKKYLIDNHKELFVIFFRGILLNMFYAFLVSHIKQMKNHEENQLELEYLKQANLQANLLSLKEQLSPHFLFNTFNTLSTLTTEQQVKDYVDQMANVYRYLLVYQKKDLIDLKQELAFTKSYLYIMQTRLDKALEVSIQIDADFQQFKIPPLTLQILVENAIKHNIASTSKPLKICMHIQTGYLEVVNNFQPKTSIQSSSGIGLTNINQRYKLLFSKELKIEMDDHFFKVKLPL